MRSGETSRACRSSAGFSYPAVPFFVSEGGRVFLGPRPPFFYSSPERLSAYPQPPAAQVRQTASARLPAPFRRSPAGCSEVRQAPSKKNYLESLANSSHFQYSSSHRNETASQQRNQGVGSVTSLARPSMRSGETSRTRRSSTGFSCPVFRSSPLREVASPLIRGLPFSLPAATAAARSPPVPHCARPLSERSWDLHGWMPRPALVPLSRRPRVHAPPQGISHLHADARRSAARRGSAQAAARSSIQKRLPRLTSVNLMTCCANENSFSLLRYCESFSVHA